MFTLGREREKQAARRYLRDSENAAAIDRVIDVVHDSLDGSFDFASVSVAFCDAFCKGGSGVWEQTASWLRKLTPEHPAIAQLWIEFAAAPKATIRFRAAACLGDMPTAVALSLLPQLSRDPSRRIRLKVASDLTLQPLPGSRDILQDWHAYEPDDTVRAELLGALEKLP